MVASNSRKIGALIRADRTNRSEADLDRLARAASPRGAAFAARFAKSDMRRAARLAALALVLSACSGSADGSSDDEGEIWNGDSAGIEFELTRVGRRLCEFSATREELTEAQLAGLASLRLHGAAPRAGCDGPTYSITIHGGDGASVSYRATNVDCSSPPTLLFEDFDAWAKSSPCSLQP